MKKKAFIKRELDKTLPKAQSDALWQASSEKLSAILQQYSALCGGVRMHTDNYIFPAAAVYLTLKKALGAEEARQVIERAAVSSSSAAGRMLAKLMRIPGMPGLFIRAWDPITKKMFSTASGFKNAFYPKEKDAYRMDVLACPYCRYFTELGCPELTRIFCENDDRAYGHLPRLQFIRTTTLGKGGARCDFLLKKT